jgi:2-C-methyl-D-erythritol 4-phosphate cytidylyltransferase
VNAFRKVERLIEIVIAVPADRAGQFQAAARDMGDIRWAIGGARRQDSVRAGLEACSAAVDYVLVHDAARPFITPQMVDLLIDTAHEYGAAIPVTPVAETLKEVSHGRVIQTVDRGRIFFSQTPQAFRRNLLHRGFESTPQDSTWTDEASMLESLGIPVATVPGDKRNVKITYPEDFQYAEYLIGRG